MASQTTNYKLILPEANDNYNIDDFNSNFRAIDAQIKANENKASNHTHGNITSDGKIGTGEDLPVFTGTGGLVGTKTAAEARNALNAAEAVAKISNSGNVASIALEHNTEYRFSSALTSLTLTFPSGDFDCWLRFMTGDSVTVTLPASATYIGGAPAFEASKTYEMSIKDGVVICAEVASE